MWQRVQTLYLAISTILIAVMVFGVKATLPAPEGIEPERFKYFTYIHYLTFRFNISSRTISIYINLSTYKNLFTYSNFSKI